MMSNCRSRPHPGTPNAVWFCCSVGLKTIATSRRSTDPAVRACAETMCSQGNPVDHDFRGYIYIESCSSSLLSVPGPAACLTYALFFVSWDGIISINGKGFSCLVNGANERLQSSCIIHHAFQLQFRDPRRPTPNWHECASVSGSLTALRFVLSSFGLSASRFW